MKLSASFAAILAASIMTMAAIPEVAFAKAHVSESVHHAKSKTVSHRAAKGKSAKGKATKASAHAGKSSHHAKGHKAHGKKHHKSHAWLVSDTAVPAVALTQDASEEIAQEEKIYDGPLPGDGYSISMDAMPDQNGRTECVQLLKTLMDAPRTAFWKEGRRLKQYFSDIRPGTAIATFVHGHYPQGGGHGKHAAIFVRATNSGIYVIDQFAGKIEVAQRFIPWHHPRDHRASNNAVSYSTVRW